MREPSFLERYGSWIATGLVALFAWSMIAVDLHETSEFGLLFPLRWIELSPIGSFVKASIAPYKHAEWLIIAEVTITVGVWMIIYFVARGACYYISSMEGPSMWVAFILFICIGITTMALLVWPAFQQINVWWAAWPGAHQPLYPQ